ncbi:LysR family transcriptional regulator [Mesorhizobium sp. M7A.T.Ca.TU.009.02.1.1]|uniref:LysR family transcriptional regulator n=1 Tax=Mesorhizobium sp. M7A.T.Ca.TU.009.02.1.1 TaxID=2496791 RepID=UPI0032AF0E6F
MVWCRCSQTVAFLRRLNCSCLLGYPLRGQAIKREFCPCRLTKTQLTIHDRPMALPSLNGMRAFEAAARLGSVKDAAEELHLTPSAVSRHIRALERNLGQDLFERGFAR